MPQAGPPYGRRGRVTEGLSGGGTFVASGQPLGSVCHEGCEGVPPSPWPLRKG